MADSESHLGPGHASGLARRSPSLLPSGRLSTDNSGSQDDLLPRNAADDNPARELGDSVPDAPARFEEVAAENPTHATNRRLGQSKDFNEAQLVLMLLNDYCRSHGLLLIRSQFPLYQKSSARSLHSGRSQLLADNLAMESRHLPCAIIHSDSYSNRCAHLEVLPRSDSQLPTL
jgi:hypothetical protein